MAFCSNCGKELPDNAQFCGNCGTKCTAKGDSNLQIKKPNIKLNKDSFVKLIPNNRMNYNSVCFKIFAVILASILIADNLGWLASYLTITFDSDLFYSLQFGKFGCEEIVESISFVLFLIFGLIFALTPIFKKTKHKLCQKKSSVVLICWVTLLLFEVLFFIISKDIFASTEYIFCHIIIETIIHILFAIFSLLVLFKNRYNNPFPAITILLAYWANQISIWTIKDELFWHNLKNTSEFYNDFKGGETSYLAGSQCFGFLAFVVFAFLISYLLPNLVAKITILIGYLPILIMDLINLFSGFSFNKLFDLIFAGTFIIFFAFAYSRVKCSDCGANVTVKNKCTKCESEQPEKEKVNYKKRIRDFSIAIGTCTVITLSLLISSGIYSAIQIDKNIDEWINMIDTASIEETEDAWDDFNNEIRSITVYAFTGAFTDNLTYYEAIRDNLSDLEDISLAYDEYYHGQVSTERADALKYINEEALSEHSFFDRYYGKYSSMQPTEDKIQVYASLTNSNRTLKITVKNNNALPLQSCTVKYDFRLLYVPTASYADNEYENGSETYILEDIGGNESKVFEFNFDDSKYYDGYYSYHFATLWNSSIDIISFK